MSIRSRCKERWRPAVTFESEASHSEAAFFDCKKCGDCCKGYGGTYVTPEDIQTIATYIHTDPNDFVEKYCRMSGTKPLLAQGKNGYCIFWDKVCTIHPVKPRMCKAWPFIKSVLIDKNNWQIMASSCPGIRGDAPYALVKAYIEKTL